MALLALVIAALAAGSPQAAGDARPVVAGAAPSFIYDGESCPERPRALPANAVAVASRVALGHEHPDQRPRVVAAKLADHRATRGGAVRTYCGRRAWHRTVVVEIDLRYWHPSASLSQRVSYVARTDSGYRVYALGH